MNPQSDLMAWLAETIKRFALRSPKFFQVYQSIGAIAVAIGFIPELLTFLQVTPDDVINRHIALAVKVAGAVMWFMAKMPVTDPHKPVDSVGDVVPKQSVMPYTVKKAETAPVVSINTPNPSA